MARFTARDLTAFRSLRAMCYQALAPMSLLELTTAALEDVIGADASCSHELDPLTHLPSRAIARGWPEEAKRPMIERVMLVSAATTTASFRESGSRVRTIEALFTELPAPRTDPYYTHHLLPFGFEHEVQVLCGVRGESRAVIALTRKPGSEAFSQRDQRFLAALAPHLGAGLARARVRELLAAPRENQIGLLILDESGRIEVVNEIAEEWLAADAQSYWPYGLALLARHLAGRETGALGELAAPIELPHPVSGSLYRLQREKRVGANGNRQTVLLLDPVRGFDQPDFLRRLGLTPREAEVAAAALRGFSVKQIALQLRCSQHTVSQHLRTVFTKLGVSSRSELAALLYRSAPVDFN